MLNSNQVVALLEKESWIKNHEIIQQILGHFDSKETKHLVVNKYKSPDSKGIYIGRPSHYGNPYPVKAFNNFTVFARNTSVIKHLFYIILNPELILRIQEELKEKELICFCSPLKCHGEILALISNDLVQFLSKCLSLTGVQEFPFISESLNGKVKKSINMVNEELSYRQLNLDNQVNYTSDTGNLLAFKINDWA
jgi:hypothetical protein